MYIYVYIYTYAYIYNHPGVDRILRFDNITNMFEHFIFYRLGYRYISHMLHVWNAIFWLHVRTDSIHGAYKLCKYIYI